MSNPRASVVIPAYNAAGWIERLLESLKRQTFRDFEVILVDDCSTDSTFDIAKNFLGASGLHYKIIKMYPNQGVSCARNQGIREACGEYICFIDSDDVIRPEYLEKLFNMAKKCDLDIAFCGYDEVDSASGKLISRRCKKSSYFDDAKTGVECFTALLRDKVKIEMVTTLYRKSMLRSANLWFTPYRKIGEDREFLYKALLEAKRVAYIAEPLYVYCRHSESTTRQNWYDKFRHCYDVGLYHQLIKFIEKKGYDDELIKTVKCYSLSRATLKMLSGFILYGEDDNFWKTLRNKKIREMLRYSYPTFFDKPEVPFKAFLALHFPKVFYRRYAKQRETNLKKHQQEISYFQERQ